MRVTTAVLLALISSHVLAGVTPVQVSDGVLPVTDEFMPAVQAVVAGFLTSQNRLPSTAEVFENVAKFFAGQQIGVDPAKAVQDAVAQAAQVQSAVDAQAKAVADAQTQAQAAYQATFPGAPPLDQDSQNTLTLIQATQGSAALNQQLNAVKDFFNQAAQAFMQQQALPQ